MDTKELTQKLQTFFHAVRRGYAGDPKPERDWNLVLLLASIVLLISIAVNAFLFLRVYEGEPLSRNTDVNPPARETEEIETRLQNLEEIFEARAAAYDSFIETTYPFVDPARN